MSTSFQSEMARLGLGPDVQLLLVSEQGAGAYLAGRVKFAAKQLGRVAGLPRTQALEAVARAVRFDSWHHLSRHLAARAGQPDEANWLNPLCHSMPLVYRAIPGREMAEPVRAAFEAFSARLSDMTDVPIRTVFDGVAAALCGAKTWQQACRNQKAGSGEDGGCDEKDDEQQGYEFVVEKGLSDGKPTGNFHLSKKYYDLIERVNAAFEGFGDLTRSKQHAKIQWLEKILATEPAFLYGRLTVAWAHYERGDPQALDKAREALEAANTMIPSGFRGEISWYHFENRFYHRLLWLKMALAHEAQTPVAAVRFARKLLRLDKGDHLGVRFILPLLFLAQGDVAHAEQACQKYQSESSDGVTRTVAALVAFEKGDMPVFRKQLVCAAFELPLMKRFFLKGDVTYLPGDEGHRGVVPDVEAFETFARPLYDNAPALEAACRALLTSTQFLQAEQVLFNQWREVRAMRPGDQRRPEILDGWRASASYWAAQLAQAEPGKAHRPQFA